MKSEKPFSLTSNAAEEKHMNTTLKRSANSTGM
jgi:hypothetical protein